MMGLIPKLVGRPWLHSCLLAIVLAVAGSEAIAQERVISEIDPPVIQQGDTVLLTIKGQNLPTGTVALEFFPQQIALLDILSASDTEVVAQIKVPSLVAPGPYNVLVYNHLGDEAFAEGLLTIASDIITPVFRDYDPKVIAEATEGFALLLSGDSITAEAPAHLRMRWFQDERELTRLSTMFSAGGPGQVVCAVTGDLPAGRLQGRVYLNDKPVYLVEITIESPTGIIVGHAPSQLELETIPYELTLIGTDLTSSFADLVEAELASADTVAKAQEVTLHDSAALGMLFSGPLPAGEYDLRVLRLDEVLYTGQVEVVEHPTEPDVPSEVQSGEEAQDQPPELPPSTAEAEPPVAPAPEVRIDSVAPLGIPADARAASLVVNGMGLGAALAERLQMRLVFNEQESELLFLGAGRQNLTCLFAPPEGGWPAGNSGTLTISDPAGQLEEYVAVIDVAPAVAQPGIEAEVAAEMPEIEPEAPAGPVPAPVMPVSWDVRSASVESKDSESVLTVILSANEQAWEPQLLSGSFNLLPDDPILPQVFSNITLAGDLVFTREDSLMARATCEGRFVSGDLLVEVRYGGGVESAYMLALAAPKPTAVATAPQGVSIDLNPVTGQLLPEIFDWQLEFAPLSINEQGFIRVTFDPPPPDPEKAVSYVIEGTRLTIGIHPAAWRNAAVPGRKLTARLDTTIQLQLIGDLAIEVPFTGAEAPPGGGGIQFVRSEAIISEDGIELSLRVPGAAFSAEQLAKVEVDSSNLLLALNAHEFKAEVDPDAGDAETVRLRLVRNAATLTDVSYALLIEELLESDEVEITLAWADLGAEVKGTVRFTEAADGLTEEPDNRNGVNEDQH